MADRVRITKAGLVTEEYRDGAWCADTPRNWIRRLRVSCTIDEGVTLGDIFRAVEKIPELKSFVADYSWCPVGEFHAQASLPNTAKEGEADEVAFLEVTAHLEYGEGLVLDFAGWDTEKTCSYSVSLTPMYELADLPVRLAEKVPVMKDCEKIGETEMFFSLLEVLDTIYDDISFHGGPRENAEFGAYLTDTLEQFKRGELQTVPLRRSQPN